MHRSNFLLWLLLSVTATMFGRSIPTISADKARQAAREQVMWQGRLCTLSSAAADFLNTVYGQTTYKGLSAVQVAYGWHLRPDVWKEEPMILIPDAALRRQLGIDSEHAAFSQLFDDSLRYRLNTLGSDLPPRMQQLVRESPAIVELDERVGLIILLTEGRLFLPRPDSIAPLSKIRVEAEVLYCSLPASTVLLALIVLSVAAVAVVWLWCRRHRRQAAAA